MIKTGYTSVKEFKEFLKEKKINNIHEFLQKFIVKFHKPEYALNTVYSNENGYRKCSYWYALEQTQDVIGYIEFIDHFRQVVQSEKFYINIVKEV